jgi:hypothetical protein
MLAEWLGENPLGLERAISEAVEIAIGRPGRKSRRGLNRSHMSNDEILI